MNKLLIVDDEKSVRYSFKRMFEDDYSVITAEDGSAALRTLDNNGSDIDAVFLDVRMPGMGGIDVLKKIRERTRNIPVIMMTAYSDSDTAIEAMKEGAFDYLIKPFEHDQLKEVIEKAVTSARLQHEAFCSYADNFNIEAETIVGTSSSIINVCKMIGQAAGSDVPVLISGESGVGKELVARAIYNHSKRKGKPFMAVNCAALPEGVVESELFGCEKGAFTGAEKRRIGRFEQCNSGTIFLDEIGDMSLSTQSKLLRVLQGGSFERVGSNETLSTDVRLITASNKDLVEEVRKGNFREDLFHRLNVFSIYVKPLRERKEDIPELSEYFLTRASRKSGKDLKCISPEAMKLLESHNWPGNVRELENAIKRAEAITTGDIIDINNLVLNRTAGKNKLQKINEVSAEILNNAVAAKDTGDIYHLIISNVEKSLVERALKLSKGNQVHASALLGITRVTLRKKMKEYNIPSV